MRPGKLQRAFGAALRKARETRDWSQETLSFNAGYDRASISLLERGLRTPKLSTVIDLAQAMGMTPMDLVADTLNAIQQRTKK